MNIIVRILMALVLCLARRLSCAAAEETVYSSAD